MSKGKELLKNTGILMIAKISTQIVNFLLMPLYTTLLTTQEYGVIDIYTSMTMIIIPFITLQIEMALFRYFIVSNNKEEKEEIISSSYFVVAIMIVITSIIYCVIVKLLNLQYIKLLYGYYFTQVIYTLLLQTCRANKKSIDYGVASFICSAFAVVLNVLFIKGLNLKAEGILISYILAQIASSVYIIFRTKVYKYFKIVKIKIKRIKALLKYSVPLVVNQVASWTINYSDHLIIYNTWGEGKNGIYAIATKFSNILHAFFSVYNVAWTESVVRNIDEEDGSKYISKVFEMTFNTYLILIIGILNVLPFCFKLLVKGDFINAYQYVPFLLMSMLFSGMAATIGSIFISYNKTKEVSITTVLAGICNITIHFALLQHFELYAAAISTLVSFVLLYTYRIIALRKFFKLEYSRKKIFFGLLIAILSWISYALKNPIYIITCFIINIGLIYILIKNNKETLKQFLKRKKGDK